MKLLFVLLVCVALLCTAFGAEETPSRPSRATKVSAATTDVPKVDQTVEKVDKIDASAVNATDATSGLSSLVNSIGSLLSSSVAENEENNVSAETKPTEGKPQTNGDVVVDAPSSSSDSQPSSSSSSSSTESPVVSAEDVDTINRQHQQAELEELRALEQELRRERAQMQPGRASLSSPEQAEITRRRAALMQQQYQQQQQLLLRQQQQQQQQMMMNGQQMMMEEQEQVDDDGYVPIASPRRRLVRVAVPQQEEAEPVLIRRLSRRPSPSSSSRLAQMQQAEAEERMWLRQQQQQQRQARLLQLQRQAMEEEADAVERVPIMIRVRRVARDDDVMNVQSPSQTTFPAPLNDRHSLSSPSRLRRHSYIPSRLYGGVRMMETVYNDNNDLLTEEDVMMYDDDGYDVMASPLSGSYINTNQNVYTQQYITSLPSIPLPVNDRLSYVRSPYLEDDVLDESFRRVQVPRQAQRENEQEREIRAMYF